MTRVITYWTDDRYRAMAERMMASAHAVGLETRGYFVENGTGVWMDGMNKKPQVVLQAFKDFPGESILFVDADCVFVQPPAMLDEKTHDMDVACCFDGPNKPTSAVLWFRGSTGLPYVEKWVDEIKKNPGRLDDYVALQNAFDRTRPKARVLHLPPVYAWVEEWLRPRFGPQKPVIVHFAVGEHKTVDLTWRKTKDSIF